MRLGSLAAMALTVGTLHSAPAGALDSRPFNERLCAGMQLEVHLASGGRVDCLSDRYAIETEWAQEWYAAVGQSLYYAGETGREPGIIILCPASVIAGAIIPQ